MSTAPEESSYSTHASDNHIEKKHPPREQLFTDKLAHVAKQLKPLAEQTAAYLEKAQPHIKQGQAQMQQYYAKLKPYHVDELAPAVLGLMLVLAGGYFPTLIATVEAVRVSGGWPAIQSSFKALHSNYIAADAASQKDDQIDANKDGIADVKQMQPGELLQRKAQIFLKSINSEQVSDAAQKLVVTLFAVLATLRIRLAYALTMGLSLASVGASWGGDVLTVVVARILPDEARRLAPLLVNGSLHVFGFFFALFFTRSAYTLYAAARGAHLLVDVAADYLHRNGSVQKDSVLVVHKAAVGAAIAVVGFLFQAWKGDTPYFLLRLVLCPVSLLEMLTNFFVGVLA